MEESSQLVIAKERKRRGLVSPGRLLKDPGSGLESRHGLEHHSILAELVLNPFWAISQ